MLRITKNTKRDNCVWLLSERDKKMNKKLAFYVLFSNHQIAKLKYKKRRKILNTILFGLIQQQEILGNTLLWGLLPASHRFWMISYRQNWFQKLWASHFDQYFREIWRRDFQSSVETFDFIKNLVKDKMEKQNTFFRKAIPLEKRVAVALWRLATGSSYRSISKVFGIGLTFVAKIVYEFCESIFQESRQFIKFPANGHETALEIEKFSYFTQTVLPQVFGIIDGTHVEILCTNSESRLDYFPYKQKYTVNTKAVVGASLTFLHVATGYSGSLHDAWILRVSP